MIANTDYAITISTLENELQIAREYNDVELANAIETVVKYLNDVA